MIVESVSRLAVIAVVYCTVAIVAAPYQELAPRAGHVPVYIRVGDTPLSEIHPKLAEAFHEIESASLLLEDLKTDLAKEEAADSLKPVEINNKNDEVKMSAAPKEGPTTNDDEEEVPATVVEQIKKEAESDIASFDVVKADRSEVEGVDKEVTAKSNETAES